MHFSSLLNIEPSATLKMNSLALAKRAKGERVFNLSAGEPMLETPESIKQAAIKALNDGKTHYPPVAGIPELRQAAMDWMNRTYGTSFSLEESLVTCGGKFGLFAACQALLNPGDEAIIIAPYWVSYSEMVKMFGGKPMIVSTTPERGWKVTPPDLQKYTTAQTKLLFLNNGSNPTGMIYSREEVRALLAFAEKNNLIVLSDEVYSGLTYDGEFISAAVFPEFRDRVVIIQSCSKHFAMTGWRVGLAFGPLELIKKMTTIQSQSTTGTASMSQYAAVAAFTNAEKIIPTIREAMRARRDIFVTTFSKLFRPIASPSAGLYAFVRMSDFGVKSSDSTAFCLEVLEKAGVALVPGVAFGQEGYVRFSFGEKEEELIEGLKALQKFVKKF